MNSQAFRDMARQGPTPPGESYRQWANSNPPQPGEDDSAYLQRMYRANEVEARKAIAWVRADMAVRAQAQGNRTVHLKHERHGDYTVTMRELPDFLKEHGLKYDRIIPVLNCEVAEEKGWYVPECHNRLVAAERLKDLHELSRAPFGDKQLLRPAVPPPIVGQPIVPPTPWHKG
jgi:hypothetical protein